MEYYEEPLPERATRQRQSSRNYPNEHIEVEDVIPSASPSTRRSTRLSRTFRNQEELETEEQLVNQQGEEPSTGAGRRSTRRKKGNPFN